MTGGAGPESGPTPALPNTIPLYPRSATTNTCVLLCPEGNFTSGFRLDFYIALSEGNADNIDYYINNWTDFMSNLYMLIYNIHF